MKRLLKAVTFLLFAASLAWYLYPPIHRVLRLPAAIHAETELLAPTLTASDGGAIFVRETGDQRLTDVQNGSVSLKLFGVLPVRTLKRMADAATVLTGGDAVGVVLHTKGVQVVGLGEVQTEEGVFRPAEDAGIQKGDIILAINGESVRDASHFSTLCHAEMLMLTCERKGKTFHTQAWPKKGEDGVFRIGAWVRDSTSGIGTLTYVDEGDGNFAALGHGVTDVDTEELLYTANGFLTQAIIYGVRIGGYGEAGELLGEFSLKEGEAIATVEKNTDCGIFGTMRSDSENRTRVAVASKETVYRGEAVILSTIDGKTMEAYTVEIIRTDVQAGRNSNGMMIQVTDERLLTRTGGIVQGMSGSPILQDGKLVGAVTHVLVNDPTRGYGIFIENMLDAAG